MAILSNGDLAALPIGTSNAQAFSRNAGDIDSIVNGLLSVETRTGRQVLSIDEAMRRIGYETPVAFASGISVTRATQTVISSGLTYHANPAGLPFTTNGTFSAGQWMLVSNITAQDLASSTPTKGADLVFGTIRSVSSVAAVRALSKFGRPHVFTLGYWAAGDGGNGEYRLDSADTTSADTGLAVIVAADGGRWKLVHDGRVSVKQAGAKGDGVTDDTVAFNAAMTASLFVLVPPGVYVISSTLNIPEGGALIGAGRAVTQINYTGTSQAIYCGQPGLMVPLRDYDLRDFTLQVANKSGVVHGIVLENAIHFNLSGLTVLGPKNPNLVETLTGYGLYIKNGSFIGRVSHTDCRLWENGIRTQTLSTAQDAWTAAIVIDGQGEIQNNSIGIVNGDTASAGFDAVGLTIRDYTIEGNYDGGIYCISGYSTTVDACYFEANGNYDIKIGGTGANPAPIGVRILNNNMSSGDMGSTPYGARTYASKIDIVKSVFSSVRDNVISAGSIPCIIVRAAADRTAITGNRLNNSAVAAISNTGNDSRIYQNYGWSRSFIQNPTLLNSWVNVGGAYQSARYYINENLFGQQEVVIEGTVSGGAAGSTIFTLPAAYRPTAGRCDFAVGQVSTAPNGIAVTAAGDVVCTVKNTASVSLNGVRFLVSLS